MAGTPKSCLAFSECPASSAYLASLKVSVLPGKELVLISCRCFPGILPKDPPLIQKNSWTT
jgi:hypothetical protein